MADHTKRNLRHKIRREIVLDEDTMRNCVENIIQRDYFPDLYKLQELKKFLKLETEMSRASALKNIPSVLAKSTPMHDEYDPVKRIMTKALNISEGIEINEDDEKCKKLTRGLSLDQFLTKYTSEDTSAFLKLQEKDQAKLRERIEWMFSQADRANQLNQLAIEGGGKDGIKEIDSANPKAIESDQKLLAIGYSKGEGKVSDSKVIAKLDENPDKEKVRIPQMQICTSEAKNSLFFQPEDNYVPVLTLDEIEDRVGKDKEIKRANTRLPTEFYTEFMKDRSQKKIVHEIDLTEEQLKDGHNYKGSTPIVHGYKLVKKMGRDVEDMQQNQKFDPVLAMHKLKNFLEKGESDEKSGGFKIPKSSTREQLSHQMVHQAESRKKREQKAKDKKRLETLQRVAGTPSRAKKGYDGLSDAAKRLASSVRGGSGLRQSILRSSTRKGGITDKVTPNVFKR